MKRVEIVSIVLNLKLQALTCPRCSYVSHAQLPPGLPHVSPWEVVSDLVVQINGLNPGMVRKE